MKTFARLVALLAIAAAVPACRPADAATTIQNSPARAGGSGSVVTADGGGLSGNGTSAKPLAVIGGPTGSYQVQYTVRAAGDLGTSNLACLYKSLYTTEGWTQNDPNGGTQAVAIGDTSGGDNNSVGGVATFATGTATNGAAELLVPNTGASRPPFNSSFNVTTKFYFAAQFQISSTVDANARVGIGSQNWLMGVIGPASATKYALGVSATAGATDHSIASTVSVDTNWHIEESWNDGVNANFGIDLAAGAEAKNSAADTTWWPLAHPTNGYPGIFFDKVGGTSSYAGAVRWALWCVAQ